MERFRAQIRKPGITEHSVATGTGVERCNTPASLAIIAEDAGYYLLRNDAEGTCIADTWHLTLNEAKAQAEYEFGVRESDWIPNTTAPTEEK